MKDGATLTVCVPKGAISNSAERNLEINLVEVTLVDPMSSPILSWVNLNGNSHHCPHLLPNLLTKMAKRA